MSFKNLQKDFQQTIERTDAEADLLAEKLLLQITEQISHWMNRNHISNAELAARLGVSRAHITQILNGKPNLSIHKLSKIAVALGCTLEPPVFKTAKMSKPYPAAKKEKFSVNE